MVWHPVTFTGSADRIGTVHRYRGNPERSMITSCGLNLAYDHGVVDIFSSKPWCDICATSIA